MINVVIVDDHELMRQTLMNFINGLNKYKIVGVAKDGYDLIHLLQKLKQQPSIAVVDVNMPIIDGIQITKILHDHYKEISVLGLSLSNNHFFVVDMLDAGAKGFISKNNIDINLGKALQTIVSGGVFVEPEFEIEMQYYLKRKQIDIIQKDEFNFSKKQIFYLQLNASALNYRSIANIMHVSEKSLHNYQESIKEKTGASSRLEQALFAFKTGIIKTMRRSLAYKEHIL